MGKKVSRRRRQTRQEVTQPLIYKTVSRTEAEDVFNTGYGILFLADPRGPHPNQNDKELTRLQGQLWLDKAAEYQDQGDTDNRGIWQGNLRRTALSLAVTTWKNEVGIRRSPNMYVADTAMMTKQRVWGNQNFGDGSSDVTEPELGTAADGEG